MFEKKKILILGMARSGYEAAKLLTEHQNKIVVNDMDENQNEEHVKELEALGVSVILGGHPEDLLDDSYDYLIKNPGIRNDHIYVKKAESLKIPVINEIEMAYHLLPKDIDIVGVTGSNGKTTTTTLIYEVLKCGKRNVFFAGNMGYPLSTYVNQIKSGDIVVMEISAQQLYNFKDFKTTVSVLTNLVPAHIDFFGDYETYQKYKKDIFKHHTAKNYAILNHEDETVMKLTEDIKSKKLYFSSKQEIKGAYLKENAIYYNDEKIMDTDEIILTGNHNYENMMCALLVGKIFKINQEDICRVFRDFRGVEHRLEYVKKLNGREIYNDSKATNVKATQIALSAFQDKPVNLILGGYDRGHSFDELEPYMNQVKNVFCLGATKERIKAFCDKIDKPCYVLDTIEEATKAAYNTSEEGDVILLSPACASWDQYKCFEDRGEDFKRVINELE